MTTDEPQNNCLFCDNLVSFDPPKYGLETDAAKVKTHGKISFVSTIKKCCEQRCDEWAFNVKGKIEFYSSDLHAADVVHHRSCSVNFRTGRQITTQYSLEEKSKGGRPENVIQQKAFLLTCNYFENNDEEQLSVVNLIDKMDEYLKDTEYSAYDRRHMKRKLEEFYGQDIIITGGSGSPTIVTYSKTSKFYTSRLLPETSGY